MKLLHIEKVILTFIVVLWVTAAAVSGAVSVPVSVTEPAAIARSGEGIHSGIPFKKGEVKSVDELILVDSEGKPVPAQFETLSRWEDGSQRWVLLIFKESVNVGQTKTYTLRTLKKNETPPSPEKVKITDKNDVFTVDTGRIRYEIPIYSGSILSNIQRRDDTGNWVTVSTKGLEAIIWRTGIKKFKSRVEEQGIRVLKNGKLVLDPKSDYMVKAIRANPKFKAKPQKWY